MARPKSRKSLLQIIDDLTEDMVPVLYEAFHAAISDVVNNVILADLIKAIEEGDITKAFRTLGFSDAAMRPITAAIERAYEAGGLATGGTFPRVLNTPAGRTVFRFDVRNSRAEAWLRDESSKLIVDLKSSAFSNVQTTLFNGMKEGLNPRSTALDIIGRINPVTQTREGGIIGLAPNQLKWVENTRRDLIDLDENYFNRGLRDKRFDSLVRKAIDNNEPLTDEQINRLVSRYKDNALRYRGESIARTESMKALSQSQYEAFKQAVDLGAVKQSGVTKEWDSAGNDGRTRASHLRMDGQVVQLDAPFETPGGEFLMYPLDDNLGASADEIIQCRCRVKYAVDWLADLD